MVELFPSLICADLVNLQKEIEQLEPHVAGFHLDIMDFHFVPNLTWGPDFINAIAKITQKKLFLHLMVNYPEKYFDRFKIPQNSIVSVHYESLSASSLENLFFDIRARGWQPSIALNPQTAPSVLHNISVNHVLLMAVEPGFSGQAFLPSIFEKISLVRESPTLTIAIDGGINLINARALKDAGVNQLAVGSALFKNNTLVENIKNFHKTLDF